MQKVRVTEKNKKPNRVYLIVFLNYQTCKFANVYKLYANISLTWDLKRLLLLSKLIKGASVLIKS